MPAEKRNDFLDAGDSDEDGGGYDSEEEIRKGGAKKRKLDDDDDDDFSDGDADAASALDSQHGGEGTESDGDSGAQEAGRPAPKKQKLQPDELPDISKPLTRKNLVATEAAVKKSGVVYISRVPPYLGIQLTPTFSKVMKPQKLRSLLEPYGTINRIFLSPEDPTAHSRRVRNGGNKKRTYTDGWVEFVKKKDAKKAVDLLNARPIGGKKGSFYRDDIWSLLYLKGFKWNNLTEQISAEAAERTSRMRAEISRTTKENKEFVLNVEKAKMVDGIQSKAATRKEKEGIARAEPKSRRTFEQAAVAKKKGDNLSADSKRVASMLF
ncbi:hypothetical protein JX266_003039 [Neoarthrinium moseri]|uniref:uncharacterized protein n=1 Tax=Neoarthrinium moseri TaxID=1658444 RepID=UPI001FDD2C96|nr:uncharacterized protein JN550_011211 [Neoarthrinium moseri]KAI1851577.1 hypothetical protein JX266_003039 [Neoarthrinium moseri]KAI1860896.1 hypothetical protein JN550_011211 [Neoarthrinium moseri]